MARMHNSQIENGNSFKVTKLVPLANRFKFTPQTENVILCGSEKECGKQREANR